VSPRPAIVDVEAIPLRSPTLDAESLDGSSETVVVRIRDEDGNVGLGEADAPAEIVRDLGERTRLRIVPVVGLPS
jgi:L-alanine-DL-glutamate epimerase-like enolase superfamily enzyme